MIITLTPTCNKNCITIPVDKTTIPGTDILILKNIFAEKKLLKLLLVFEKKMIITLVLHTEIRQLFRRKLPKIAKSCDHNIDPRALVLQPASMEGGPRRVPREGREERGGDGEDRRIQAAARSKMTAPWKSCFAVDCAHFVM
jgi:hypothetical protein